MKRKSLGFESMEQRTVLSASAIVAVEHLAAADSPGAHTAVPQQIQPAAENGAEAIRVMPGDFNFDGSVDDVDIDMLCGHMKIALASTSVDTMYDLTEDGIVDGADMDMLIREIIRTEYGDANLDGEIDEVDATMLFQNMFTESSGWNNGDFSCDGVIDGQDFVLWNNYKFTETKLGSGTYGAPSSPTGKLEFEMAHIKTAAPVNAPVEVTAVSSAPETAAPETAAPVTSVAAPVVTAPVIENVAARQTADQTENQDGKMKCTYDKYEGDVTLATGNVADQSPIRFRFASLRRSFR